MGTEDDSTLPDAARLALRDLLASLEREKIQPHVQYLPNGSVRCTWFFEQWLANASITEREQTIKYCPIEGGAYWKLPQTPSG